MVLIYLCVIIFSCLLQFYTNYKVPIEVRIDYVVDNRIEKTDLEEFLLENGGRQRCGIGRLRAVRSQTEKGKASLFICMTPPCYNGWLLHTVNTSVVNRKTYRGYKEGESFTRQKRKKKESGLGLDLRLLNNSDLVTLTDHIAQD
ncbi:hypothetical protein BpHYR1_043555 [Brachionus plicatilis]|uniref:Uncharacterized protein n=1 Tax=Brachionus plicatilis TaxID=10195 RepID=A0A3M7PXA5_BRAPC|nr:hypothetical protein BpHYR1_043555 [Brachionus plicatilis]